MKKIYLSVLGLALSATVANAQYNQVTMTNLNDNPKQLNMDPEQPEAYLNGNGFNWKAVLSSGASTWSTAETIPFSFDFNGNAVSSYHVHPNGVVTFTANPAQIVPAVPAILPDFNIPDNSITVWGMGITGPNDGVVSKTFGTAPNRQHWVMWASATGHKNSTWAYWAIVFEEGTNNIFIVDQRTYGTNCEITAGIQVSQSIAYYISGSPALGSNTTSTAGNQSDPFDNTVYGYYPGTQRTNDAYGQGSSISKFVQLGNTENIQVDVINFGSAAITSLEIDYTVNGGTPVTHNATGLNIAPGTIGTALIPWTAATAGQADFTFAIKKVNGSADDSPANDAIPNASTIVVDEIVQRFPLIETFTSSTCPPCNAGNANMEGILAQNPYAYASIKYQQDFPGAGDPYCTTEAVNRRGYYGVSGIPNTQIDGGWDGNSQSFDQTTYKLYQEAPAFTRVRVIDLQRNGNTISGRVMVDPVASINSSSLVCHIAIIEKKTTANVATNGETEFINVVKKMLPNDNGTAINALAKGVHQYVPFTYTFNGSYRLPANGQTANRINDATEHSVEEFTDLEVVAWVQDNSTKEVLNAIDSRINLGSDEISISENLVVTTYPNPAQDQLNVNITVENSANVNVSLVNIVGSTVYNATLGTLESGDNIHTVDVSALAPGIYLLNVSEGTKTMTKKVIIK